MLNKRHTYIVGLLGNRPTYSGTDATKALAAWQPGFGFWIGSWDVTGLVEIDPTIDVIRQLVVELDRVPAQKMAA